MVYENYYRSLRHFQAPFNRWEHIRKTAKALKLSRRALQRLEWFIYYETKAKSNASLTCRYFGITTNTFYKWQKLFDPMNLRLLEDKDKSPKHVRRWEVSFQEEQRVV
jgi:putative transposase